MKLLYILYDAKCGLCRKVRIWLDRQPAYVKLRFQPLQSAELEERFPGIAKFSPEEQLVVISDKGSLWRGESAWIVILWALREYREWSQRLATPTLRPFARKVCGLVSENRLGLSRWLGFDRGPEFRRFLAALPENTACEFTPAHKNPPPLPCRAPY